MTWLKATVKTALLFMSTRAGSGTSALIKGTHRDDVMDDELLMPSKEPSETLVCVHGTRKAKWEKILDSDGISRMSRNHVHFSPKVPKDDTTASGVRSNCDVAMHVDVAAAMNAGLKFTAVLTT